MTSQKHTSRISTAPSRWGVGAAAFALASIVGAGWVLAQHRDNAAGAGNGPPHRVSVQNLEQSAISGGAIAGGECIGDLTGTHQVGGADLGILLSCWGPVAPGGSCESADLNGSGDVDGADLGLLLSNWGPCPAPSCDYQHDQNDFNGAVGWDGPAVLMWMHRFDVPEEVDLIWAIQSAFGTGVDADDPVGYAIYEVDDNGAPGDLLFHDTCTVNENVAGTENRQVFTVPGVPVEDEIFIAVYVEDPGDGFVPAPLDQSVTDQEANVWIAADEVDFDDFEPDGAGQWTLSPTTLSDFNIEGVWVQCASGLESVTPDDADGFFFDIDDEEGEGLGSPRFGRFIERIWGEQARATGDLVVADGQTLSGTVVAENIYMEDGGRVYIAPDTRIIATNDIWLGSALVPLPDDRPKTPRKGGDRGGDSAAGQSWCGDCDGPNTQEGDDGDDASRIRVYFGGEATVPTDHTFADICSGAAGAGEPGEEMDITGGPDENVHAIGGNGGDGADVVIWGGTLNVNGLICNGRGGDGGHATAVAGPQDDDCTCGCDARAEAGRGGRPGRLYIATHTLNFGLAGSVTFSACGDGGEGDAAGSDGTLCPCLAPGGDQRGGWAEATGGDTRPPRRFCISGRWNMPGDGGLNEFVAGHLDFPDGPDGGIATAQGGEGGPGDDCDCGIDGVDAGPGGDAFATGGEGERGYSAVGGPGGRCRVMTVILAAASDGGEGGEATASGGAGGDGGWGTFCFCPQPGPAGDGGDGGTGGNASATGGDGGRASLRSGVAVPDGYTPVSGDGGDSEAGCGDGGDGGVGADCGFDLDPQSPCIAGVGGAGAAEGSNTADGGDHGISSGSATDGADGAEITPACDEGEDGDDGWNWCHDGPPPAPGNPPK